MTDATTNFLILMPVGRVGSNVMTGMLNNHPEVMAANEYFWRIVADHREDGRDEIGRKQAAWLREFFLGEAYREIDIHRVKFDREHAGSLRALGIKLSFFSIYAPDDVRRVCRDAGVRVILMRRKNHLKAALSSIRAKILADESKKTTGKAVWGIRDPRDALGPTRVDPDELLERAEEYRDQDLAAREWARSLEAPLLELEYEELNRDKQAALDAALGFLGMSPIEADTDFVKATRDDLGEAILNLGEVRQRLSGTEFAAMIGETHCKRTPAPEGPIERLAFDDSGVYSGVETAIHLGRYAAARPLCPGKRVLDAACGEGYGTSFLKRWGAGRVDGVDRSETAVARAERHFSGDGIRFHRHDVERLDGLFAPDSFDMVVSLETIEHLQDPQRFLESIRVVATDAATIVLSCPNDHWYYPGEEQGSPHHSRKYTFEEFRELAQAVLGPAVAWQLGVPVLGFANRARESDDAPIGSQLAMMDAVEARAALVGPPEAERRPDVTNCSYFLGLWGEPAAIGTTLAAFPVTMNEFREYRSASGWKRRVGVLEAALAKLEAEHDATARELRATRRELQDARYETKRLGRSVLSRAGRAGKKALAQLRRQPRKASGDSES